MMKSTTKYMVVKVNNMMYVRVFACIHVTERLKNSSTENGEEELVKLQWSDCSGHSSVDPSPGL